MNNISVITEQFVVATSDDFFLAIDNSSGYPFWTRSLGTAQVFHSKDRAEESFENLKTAFYNSDHYYNSDRQKEVYVAQLMFASVESLTW